MKLVIVESPGKIKTIKKYLPEDFDVIASIGHVMEIPKDGLNIRIDDGSFLPIVRISPDKQEVVNVIKMKSKFADEIFVCSDFDSEGERIANDIAHLIEDKSKIRRSVFQEITKKAVNYAIENPRQIDLNKVNGQITRQVLDRLIGYLVSPMLWNKNFGGKSAGRVQSVALKLIAEREFEIESFNIEKFWDIAVCLKIGDEVVSGIVKTGEKSNRFLNKEDAEKAKNIISKAQAIVEKVDKKKTSKSAYPPFDTADLQKSASSMLGWSSSKTMEVAQKLYEFGKSSYHRTDSYNVSDEAVTSCSKFVEEKFGKKYIPSKPNKYDQKGSSQEAHECIRPTSLVEESFSSNESDDLNEDEKKLLSLIKARFVASQMSNMEIEKTNAIIGCDSYKVLLEAKSVLFDGWNKVWKTESKESLLPPINKGEEYKIVEVVIKEHETRPPDRYNDGSLIEKMKKEGVGRPSTWHTLVDTLIKRNYVIKDKKNFVLTEIGKNVFLFLEKEFNNFFMDIKFTSKVEEELDKISQGKANRIDVTKSFYESLDAIVNKERRKAWAELFK